MARERSVVLAGAGHAHLHVALHSDAFRQRGARVVLIDPDAFWYSGLATGMLGGMYSAADDQLSPGDIIRGHGGHFIQDWVASVNPKERRVHLGGGDSLRYDYLSLNVGSRVDLAQIAGASESETTFGVKPISSLWGVRRRLESLFASGTSPRIAVVGGGPAGIEVAANLQALSARWRAGAKIALITRDDRLLGRMPQGAANSVARSLAARGVDIRTRTSVAERTPNSLVPADGRPIGADLVIVATGLQAASLIHETGLAFDRRGLRVNEYLQSVGDRRIFAAGDCASVEGRPLPKLGVFSVRQAAQVHRNLLAQLDGNRLAPYRPQKRALTILNLGDGRALANWGRYWWHGRISMLVKDRIDRRFLRGYGGRASRPSDLSF